MGCKLLLRKQKIKHNECLWVLTQRKSWEQVSLRRWGTSIAFLRNSNWCQRRFCEVPWLFPSLSLSTHISNPHSGPPSLSFFISSSLSASLDLGFSLSIWLYFISLCLCVSPFFWCTGLKTALKNKDTSATRSLLFSPGPQAFVSCSQNETDKSIVHCSAKVGKAVCPKGHICTLGIKPRWAHTPPVSPDCDAPATEQQRLPHFCIPDLPRRRRKALSILAPKLMLALHSWLLAEQARTAVRPKVQGTGAKLHVTGKEVTVTAGRLLPSSQPRQRAGLREVSVVLASAGRWKGAGPQWGLTVVCCGPSYNPAISPVILPTQHGTNSCPKTQAHKSQGGTWLAWPSGSCCSTHGL